VNEDKLIRQCKSGSRTAQRELFDAHYRTSFRIAVRYLGNHHDAEDVVADAFIRVFNGLHTFDVRTEGSLGRWIHTLVINESLRFLKRRRLLVLEEDMALYDDYASESFDASDFDAEQIKQVLATMPAGYRTVFNLYAIEGFSHKEIAQLIGISETTSRSQLCKARSFIIQRITNIVSHENV